METNKNQAQTKRNRIEPNQNTMNLNKSLTICWSWCFIVCSQSMFNTLSVTALKLCCFGYVPHYLLDWEFVSILLLPWKQLISSLWTNLFSSLGLPWYLTIIFHSSWLLILWTFCHLFCLPALCLTSKPELSWLCGDVPFWPVELLRWQRRKMREWTRRRETKRDWERTVWQRPRPHAFCGQAEGQHWHSSHAGTLQAWGFCSTTPSQRERIIPINMSAWFSYCFHKMACVDLFVLFLIGQNKQNINRLRFNF